MRFSQGSADKSNVRGWRANFVSAKAQKPQEYFVYFKVFVTQADAKFAAKRARGFIQRFLKERKRVMWLRPFGLSTKFSISVDNSFPADYNTAILF